jgi:hypothetical protein
MPVKWPAPRKFGAAVLLSCALVATSGSWAGASPSAALAEAKKHVLTLAAMPKGWKIEPGSTYSTGKNNNFPGQEQLASCIGVPAALIKANFPEEDSPYYQNKDGSLEVLDAVTVFPSARIAKTQYAAIAGSKTPRCYAALMNSSAIKSQLSSGAPAGTTIGTVTVTRAAHLPKHTAGFTATIPVTSNGQSSTVHVTQVFMIKGHRGHQLSLSAYGAGFPASLSQRVATEAKANL